MGARWVRVDVNYLTNPKVMSVDRDGLLLHLASILWCGDQVTDGAVPSYALPVLGAMGRVRQPARAAAALVDARLYVPNGDGGWHLHDFETINRQATREAVEAERAAWADRQSRARSRKASRRDSDVTHTDDTTQHDTTHRATADSRE